MKKSVLTNEMKQLILTQAAKSCRSIEDVQDFLKDLTGPLLEKMLEGEMVEHLGYEKHSSKGYNTGNSRNGSQKKKLASTSGEIEVQVPRDRNGEFHPQILEKFKTNTSEIEQKIINMYGLGLTTRQIQEHVKDIYGASISPMAVSRITDQILPEIHERQTRPLEACYPVMFLDAIHCKVKENGSYKNKAVYMVVGYNLDGMKEMLGFYIGHSESSKFWMNVCNDLNNRGVKDVCICCIDGLSGFADAIRSVFPMVEIQRCIVHMIRNSLRYVSHKDMKSFKADLMNVYKASTLEGAEKSLDEMESRWGKNYGIAITPWVKYWSDVSTYFGYPPMVRRIIYTTNIIESNNAKIRKVVRKGDVFSTEGALRKKMYLAIQKCVDKRTMPVHHWGQILAQLHASFPEVLSKYL